MSEELTVKKQTIEPSPEMRKFNQAMNMAITLSRSSIVPLTFRGKPDDIYACVMLGSELGFQPMMALNSIVIIQGTATLKAQTMLAVVRSKCKDAVIDIKVDEQTKIAIVTAKRDDNDIGYTAEWNMEKAKLMGLAGRDNWIKQPSTMLRWRAVSEALRMVFPDILMGIYTPEEMSEVYLVEQVKNNISQVATETFTSKEEET